MSFGLCSRLSIKMLAGVAVPDRMDTIMIYIPIIAAVAVTLLIVLHSSDKHPSSLKRFDFDGAKQGEKEKRGPML